MWKDGGDTREGAGIGAAFDLSMNCSSPGFGEPPLFYQPAATVGMIGPDLSAFNLSRSESALIPVEKRHFIHQHYERILPCLGLRSGRKKLVGIGSSI